MKQLGKHGVEGAGEVVVVVVIVAVSVLVQRGLCGGSWIRGETAGMKRRSGRKKSVRCFCWCCSPTEASLLLLFPSWYGSQEKLIDLQCRGFSERERESCVPGVVRALSCLAELFAGVRRLRLWL